MPLSAARCCLAAVLLVGVTGCSRAKPDADVIVVGAGIAGLSAALEASAAGKTVILLDANSVGGGHAVKAGGLALVGTELQEKRGYHDNPEIAERDLLAWGEDADPGWVKRYVTESRKEVSDWLEGFGVEWTVILDTPEHSVPRFHFASGSAVNVVVPLMWAVVPRSTIDWRPNTQAVSLLREGKAVTGARVVDLRNGQEADLHASAVVIATGGWEANLELVRASWPKDRPFPGKLYIGAGQFAEGTGIGLARKVGAATERLDHQAIFTNGLPDPEDDSGARALLAQNPAAIWVNAQGRRFIDEHAPSKVADAAVLGLSPATHWLVFDAAGMATFTVRGAVWLNSPRRLEPLHKAGLVKEAATIAGLATEAGLPADALQASVSAWNDAVAAGNDRDFARFTPDKPDRFAKAITTGPFYAVQLYPMTRKSMGGLRIDSNARVLDRSGQPVAGLYAAGEVAGVAGINGSFGGEGTFLGPSVLLGRIAGRSASGSATTPSQPARPDTAAAPVQSSADPKYRQQAVLIDEPALERLVRANRPGYWHFGAVHRTVMDRGLNCLNCHSPDWPTVPAVTVAQRQIQLYSCTRCH